MKKLIKIAAMLTSAIMMLTLTACAKNLTPQQRQPFEVEYVLHNWYATAEEGLPTITVTTENYTTIQFPVPEREHFTFKGWYIGNTMVADSTGKSVMTQKSFYIDTTDIYAKWSAPEQYTFKLLLVYVTEIQDTLHSYKYDEDIAVNYRMSEQEREVYGLTTKRVSDILNYMFDGFINFQVDEYYTTQALTAENFHSVSSGVHSGDNDLALTRNSVSETSDMLPEYDSALFVINMDDYKLKLHSAYGSAGARYGTINFDTIIAVIDAFHLTIEDACNCLKKEEYKYDYYEDEAISDGLINTFLHEFTHTIELRIHLLSEFHGVLSHFNKYMLVPERDVIYFYLWGQVEIDGVKKGIPYEFWSELLQ